MNKMKIVFGIGIVLAVLAVFTAPVAAYNVFHLIPEDSSCDGAGCTTTVWVKVNTSYDDINGLQASIIFDPGVVNVTIVEEGTSPDWYMWDWHIFTSGGHTYVKITTSDVMGAFGPGELDIGKMTLHCEAAGISSLHFADASEVTADDQTMIVNPSHTSGIWPITMEDGTFTCVSPPETFTKDLVVGWNLISLPLTNDTDMKVSNIIDASLGTLGTNYDALYKYDASTNSFVELSSGDTMANGVGYFIHITTADNTWTYSGNAYNSMTAAPLTLTTGLNMVGWLNCSKPISGNLTSIDGNYYYAAGWDATTQSYVTYNPAAPDPDNPTGFNNLFDMERGAGYFISMKTGDTLDESC